MAQEEMQIQQSTSATHDFNTHKSSEFAAHVGAEQIAFNAFEVGEVSNQNELVAVLNPFGAQFEGLDIAREAFEYPADAAKVSFDNLLAPHAITDLGANEGMPSVFAGAWPILGKGG